MRRIGVAALLTLGAMACNQQQGGEKPAATTNTAAATAGAPQTEEQKTLYALGLSLGRNLQNFQLTPEELQHVQSGVSDVVLGNEPKVELQQYAPKIGQLSRERAQKRAETEKAKGKEFAEKVVAAGGERTESGLVFKSITEGTGEQPEASDQVKVHYKGTLIDGTEFDSSYKRNQPATFPLQGVIKCWTEGLQKMKVGGKAQLVCPSDIAYGDFGRPNIPGGATLNFEVELLEVMDAPAAAPPSPRPTFNKPPPPTGKPAPKTNGK